MRAHPVALGALGSVTEEIIKTAVNVGRFGSQMRIEKRGWHIPVFEIFLFF